MDPPTVFHYDPATRTGTPLALGMTRAEVARIMAGAPDNKYRPDTREWYGGFTLALDTREWYCGSTLALEYDAAGALQFVAINTGSSDLQLVVHGRDLAHMPKYQVCEWIRTMDPSATADGDGGVVSQRLGVFVWNDDANQFDPTAPASQVGYMVPRPSRPGSDHLFGVRHVESLAWCFEVGHNVEVDGARARALYEEAATSGAVFAQARCNQMGWGTPANALKALRLYLDVIANDRNNSGLALLCAGLCLEHGVGIDVDPEMAAVLYEYAKDSAWTPYYLLEEEIIRVRVLLGPKFAATASAVPPVSVTGGTAILPPRALDSSPRALDLTAVHVAPHLPAELLERILASLSVADLLACRQVSRSWRAVVDTFFERDRRVWYACGVNDASYRPGVAGIDRTAVDRLPCTCGALIDGAQLERLFTQESTRVAAPSAPRYRELHPTAMPPIRWEVLTTLRALALEVTAVCNGGLDPRLVFGTGYLRNTDDVRFPPPWFPVIVALPTAVVRPRTRRGLQRLAAALLEAPPAWDVLSNVSAARQLYGECDTADSGGEDNDQLAVRQFLACVKHDAYPSRVSFATNDDTSQVHEVDPTHPFWSSYVYDGFKCLAEQFFAHRTGVTTAYVPVSAPQPRPDGRGMRIALLRKHHAILQALERAYDVLAALCILPTVVCEHQYHRPGVVGYLVGLAPNGHIVSAACYSTYAA